MHLFRVIGSIKAQGLGGLFVVRFQVGQRFALVSRGDDTGNTLDEIGTMTGGSDGVQKERRFLHAVSVEEASNVRQVSLRTI